MTAASTAGVRVKTYAEADAKMLWESIESLRLGTAELKDDDVVALLRDLHRSIGTATARIDSLEGQLSEKRSVTHHVAHRSGTPPVDLATPVRGVPLNHMSDDCRAERPRMSGAWTGVSDPPPALEVVEALYLGTGIVLKAMRATRMVAVPVGRQGRLEHRAAMVWVGPDDVVVPVPSAWRRLQPGTHHTIRETPSMKSIENHTTRLIGRIEATTIEDGTLVRKPVYLGAYGSGEWLCITHTPDDSRTATFESLADLQTRFEAWWSSGNRFNRSTVLHPETLVLVERHGFDTMAEKETA